MPENSATATGHGQLQRIVSTSRVPPIGPTLARWVTRVRLRFALIRRARSVRRAVLGRVVAAVVCTALALWCWHTLSAATTLRETWGDQVTVVVARHDIPPGRRVRSTDTVTETRPQSLTPKGAISELHADTVTSELVLAGEPLLTSRLRDSGDDPAPAGTTAMRLEPAVPAPQLQVGGRVDVLGIRSAPPSTDHGGPPGTDVDPPGVSVLGRDAVVLRAPSGDDPTIEVAVHEADVPRVAEAAMGTGVAVVRRSR